MSHAPPTRGVSQPLPVCIVPPPQSPRPDARNGDVIALGPRSSDLLRVWGSDHKGCDHQHTSGLRNVCVGRECELGRVPSTDEGLVPSQTYKDLVECADDTVVLTEIGSNTDRFSNQGRVGTKRGRLASDCAK